MLPDFRHETTPNKVILQQHLYFTIRVHPLAKTLLLVDDRYLTRLDPIIASRLYSRAGDKIYHIYYLPDSLSPPNPSGAGMT